MLVGIRAFFMTLPPQYIDLQGPLALARMIRAYILSVHTFFPLHLANL